jgi:gamma-glutamyltranspeptidase / glutathione hydrolase
LSTNFECRSVKKPLQKEHASRNVLILSVPIQAAEPRVQTRSMIISQTGIVATEQPLASQAAAQILADGGNAVDAAIAANAMMGLVGPMMCGIGGDMFCIVYDAKTQKLYGLNASGWSPQGLTREFLEGQGITKMPTNGIHSVTVPGCVEGWAKLSKRFGKKKLSQVLQPAIEMAERGFPVTELTASYWKGSEKKLARTTNAARTYLPNAAPPKVGEMFHNSDLAWSYRQIASRGRKGFYEGPVAKRIVEFSRANGGTMAPDDLHEYEARWVEPISTTYRGWTVYEIPPNGQGIGALAMLNIMERFPMSSYSVNSVDALHVMIEAKKLAYADMLKYVADPDFTAVPVKEILSKTHAAARAKLIDAAKANCNVEGSVTFEPGPDTTYLCVVDKEGNMVSYIQSNYESFGTGLVPDGCGFALHNRGALFSFDPQHPNVIAGRKRPVHTIIPAMMEKGDVRIAFGIMGGWNQSQAHAQFVSKVVDFGLNIQSALDTPRFTKLTFPGCDVKIESRIDQAVRDELTRRGHDVRVVAPFDQDVGGGQAVMRDYSTGVNFGGSDPRKDGAAIPEPYGKSSRR